MASYYRIRRFSTVARTDEDLAMSMVDYTVYASSRDMALLHAAAFANRTESQDRGLLFVDLMASNPGAQMWDYDGIRYSVTELVR